MAKTVTTTTTVTLSGDGWGGSGPLFSESVENDVGVSPSFVTLSSGNNTIAVPASATGVVIVPTPGSTVALTLKGIAGDTGIPLDPALSTSLKFTAGAVASFVLNAASGTTVSLVWR